MKIKTKITLNFSIIVGCILIIFSVIIYSFSEVYRKEQFYSRLKDKALTTAKLLFEIKEVDKVLLKIIYSADQTLLFNEKVVIYDIELNEIYDSREEVPLLIDIHNISEFQNLNEKRFNSAGTEIIYLKLLEKGKEYYVFASAYDKYGYSKIQNLLQILVFCLLISILLLVIAGRFFARRLLMPISDVISQVEHIDVQNISSRVKGG